jgi:hypothetical protein
MPQGKPAGVACIQLGAQRQCLIFGSTDRPAVCASLQPSHEMCGDSPAAAIAWLTALEHLTRP